MVTPIPLGRGWVRKYQEVETVGVTQLHIVDKYYAADRVMAPLVAGWGIVAIGVLVGAGQQGQYDQWQPQVPDNTPFH